MKKENIPGYPCAVDAMLKFKAEFQGSRPVGNTHRADVGKTILSRDVRVKGTVTGISSRYCAACGYNHPCYLVTWEDGRKTKPCTKRVKNASDDALQIY